MNYQLKVKPFKEQAGKKYRIIQVSDIALHTTKKKATKSPGKKIKESMDMEKPGRIYGSIEHTNSFDKFFLMESLKRDPEFIKLVQENAKEGYGTLVSLPKDGIPILAGKDTEEFVKSKNGKRILRRLEKNKNRD